MNKEILKPEVQEFIDKNLNTEVTRIILKGSPFKNITSKELVKQIQSKLKAKSKLPTWFATKNIYYPYPVSIEQTSSEIAANYKSHIIRGKKLIDITGGFGIDAYYFSKKFKNVAHCEINEVLSKITKYNYEQLGVTNIKTITGNGFDYLKSLDEKFDCIFIDPSRRNKEKGKVFLLKDCLPQIPPKIDFFFTKSNIILIKVSPILDISNAFKELKNVKEIHIIAIKNEVKELLFLLEKGYKDKTVIKTINILKEKNQEFNTYYKKEVSPILSEPKNYLYEPNVAILKSGAFSELTHSFNVTKLHEHSHLYTSSEWVDFPGRAFKIEKILSYDKKKLKKELKSNKANISTRNFPKTVIQIRKETKIKDGGNLYIFCTTNQQNKHLAIICTKK